MSWDANLVALVKKTYRNILGHTLDNCCVTRKQTQMNTSASQHDLLPRKDLGQLVSTPKEPNQGMC